MDFINEKSIKQLSKYCECLFLANLWIYFPSSREGRLPLFFLDLCSGFQIPRVLFKDAFLFVSEVQFVQNRWVDSHNPIKYFSNYKFLG